jgi:hypothetical protein
MSDWLRRRELWLSIGLITFVAVISYAPFFGQLGFYRDDWYQLWAGETLGARSIITLFSIDRPAMGYLYALTYRLLGDSPLPWQVYSLFLRWLGALAALWLLRRLWPQLLLATTSAVLLMLVYPGFLQQPNANTFSNHLFAYTSALISLAASVESLHHRSVVRWLFVGLAVATALASWITYEYMIGLQAVGYLLLARHTWRTHAGPARYRWGKVVAVNLPFLIPLAVFLIYRLFYFQANRAAVDVGRVLADYQPAPVAELARRLIELGKDFVEAVALGWAVPAYDLYSSATPSAVLVGLLLSAVAVLAYFAFARWIIRRGEPVPSGGDPGHPYREFVGVGAFAVVAATLPVILAGRDIRWASAFDRYSLHATLGVGLLVTGLVFGWMKSSGRKWAIAALLGLAVLTHQGNAAAWATFWNEQRAFWWQLTWRAPGLEPGTVLLATLPSQRFFEDYEVWGPANLIYAAGRESPPIASEVVEELTAIKARQGLREVRSMRVVIGIPRDYSRVLMASWSSPKACLHVMDRDQLEPSASDTNLVLSLGALSDVDRIVVDAIPAVPPWRIFGQEPERGWCWFYQTASLARQRGDWGSVVDLAEQAEQMNVGPQDPTEWMPFFQGYVNLGRLEDARRLAAAIRGDALRASSMCHQLSRRSFKDEASFAVGRQLLCDEG